MAIYVRRNIHGNVVETYSSEETQSKEDIEERFSYCEDKIITSVTSIFQKKIKNYPFAKCNKIEITTVYEGGCDAFSIYDYTDDVMLFLWQKAKKLIEKIPRGEIEDRVCLCWFRLCRPSFLSISRRLGRFIHNTPKANIYKIETTFSNEKVTLTVNNDRKISIAFVDNYQSIIWSLTYRVYQYIKDIFLIREV